MAEDEDNKDKFLIAAYQNYDDKTKPKQRKIKSCSSKDAFFRSNRRSSPYGECKTYALREAHPNLSFGELQSDSRSNGKFRLTPRTKDLHHESPAELIGIF